MIDGPAVFEGSVGLSHRGALVFSPCDVLVNKVIVSKEAEAIGFMCEVPVQRALHLRVLGIGGGGGGGGLTRCGRIVVRQVCSEFWRRAVLIAKSDVK